MTEPEDLARVTQAVRVAQRQERWARRVDMASFLLALLLVAALAWLGSRE